MNDSTRQSPLSIIAIVAHPHDATQCMGTCGIHVRRGDKVTVVSLTDGRTTHDEAYDDELHKPVAERNPAIMNRTIEEYAERKKNELRLACSYFGITDVRFTNSKEPFILWNNWNVVHELKSILLDVRPDVVIAHSPYIGGCYGMHKLPYGVHQDHTEAAYFFYEAASLCGTPDYHEQFTPLSFNCVYYMGPFASPTETDFFVDVSDWVDKRVLAEAAFTTQGHDKVWAERRIEMDVGHDGWRSGTRYSECFLRSSREMFSHLPVLSYMKNVNKKGHKEHMNWLIPEKGATVNPRTLEDSRI